MPCIHVRGILGSNSCSLYGLHGDDLATLVTNLEYEPSAMSITFDEIDFKLPPSRVINSLLADGYQIQFASPGHWTLIKNLE